MVAVAIVLFTGILAMGWTPAGAAPQPAPPDAGAAAPGGPFAGFELVRDGDRYFGGCRGRQGFQDLAVDSQGNLVAAGFEPWNCDRGEPDFFVAEFATGSGDHALVALSALPAGGGVETANGVAVDATGDVYIAGATSSHFSRSNFVVVDPFQGDNAGPFRTFDAFVMKLGEDSLLYSTFLGGSGEDLATDIAVDDEGRIIVVGTTDSEDFPTESPLQGSLAGGRDVFVSVFTPDGSDLVFSTYLGGSGDDQARRLAILRDQIFVTGITDSPDLPVRLPGRGGVLSPVYGGGPSDAFVARIDGFRRLGYAGYLGGSGEDAGYGVAVDRSGSAFVSGTTDSIDFPTRRALQGDLAAQDEADVFLVRLGASGARARYSTYLDVSGSAACQELSQERPAYCASVAVADDGTAFVTANGFFALAVSKNGRRILGELEGVRGNAIAVSDAGFVFSGGVTSNLDLPLAHRPPFHRRFLFDELGWWVRLVRQPE